MSRPLLLDLFCGAGGAAMGYHQAGFDVVGVDIKPQPHYPFEFHEGDATEPCGAWFLGRFDGIVASPPCQDHIRGGLQRDHGTGWMLERSRNLLVATGLPWVIENVPGAPMRADYRLCGCMFGLDVRRERWFETSWRGFDMRPPCDHSNPAVGVYGHPHGNAGAWPGMLPGSLETWRKGMGINWMDADELREAIPPAYTEYIGRQLLDYLGETNVPRPVTV